ncbi:hypothetical protein J6590_082914 [Homalodisca vitripennis]|nr:hypothetical protein J6590_082914 [Homalodisca vitripennis]
MSFIVNVQGYYKWDIVIKQVQNSQTDDTNPGGDQESMEWEEIDDDTSLLIQLQNWSIAEDLSMECDTTENTEYATATGSSY